MIDYQKFLAERTGLMRASEIRELLKLTEGKKVISFAGGLPDPQVFPKAELAEIARDVILERGDKALQYSPTKGVTEFRVTLLNYMKKKGIAVRSDDDVIVTTGSQQALDIVGRTMINPQDVIIVELPTYLAALNAFRLYRPTLVGIPIDDNGMRTDILEEEVKKLVSNGKRVKFIYTIPVAHNPAGVTLSIERKKHLIEIASQYDILIIEDDPYSYFVYDEGVDITPLKTLDKEGRVVYLSTLSKILAPGLRIGWILGNKTLIDVFERAKQSSDLHTSTLSQFIAIESIKRGVVDRTVERAKMVYKKKRDMMLEALEKYMVKGAWWSKPIGGLFLMLRLPSTEVDTKKLLSEAIEAGVAFVPGASFFADGSGWNTMRLNFSYPKLEEIEEGIRILSEIVKKKLKQA
ncbi:MAG: PLP-dependent aminotransferase family protein [Desulfurococcales archaeon]|nr:PLP-dependent aminotransferase family protein [Desulfurococcales archaeon]